MLALPPYELLEEETNLSSAELAARISSLVAELCAANERKLERIELRWDHGKTVLRALFKRQNPEDDTCTTGLADPPDRSGTSIPEHVLAGSEATL